MNEDVLRLTQRKQEFLLGMKQIFPIAAAGIVDGLVFGILARQAGLGVAEAVLFSLLVNAGSSQFAALGFVTQGIVGWPMLVSTALLNARQMLYGLSLGPSFRTTSPWKLSLMAAWLNDETYALKSTYLAQGGKSSLAFFFGASLVDYLVWNGSTVVGAVFGTFIADPERYGLDFAFVATFLGFLAINLTSRFFVKVGILAAVFACIGYYFQGTTLAVILGTLSAVGLGVFQDER